MTRIRSQRAQAAVETAMTIPIMLLMVTVFFVVGLDVEAHVELETAVRLATISAATAPVTLGDGVARNFATMSFNASKEHFHLIKDSAEPLVCNFVHPTVNPTNGFVLQQGSVTCSDVAHLAFLRPAPDQVTAKAVAHISPYRELP